MSVLTYTHLSPPPYNPYTPDPPFNVCPHIHTSLTSTLQSIHPWSTLHCLSSHTHISHLHPTIHTPLIHPSMSVLTYTHLSPPPYNPYTPDPPFNVCPHTHTSLTSTLQSIHPWSTLQCLSSHTHISHPSCHNLPPPSPFLSAAIRTSSRRADSVNVSVDTVCVIPLTNMTNKQTNKTKTTRRRKSEQKSGRLGGSGLKPANWHNGLLDMTGTWPCFYVQGYQRDFTVGVVGTPLGKCVHSLTIWNPQMSILK